MSARPSVLLMAPNLAFIEPILTTRYSVLKAWEDPHQSLLEAVRALVCLGHQSPAEYIDRLPLLGLVACYTTGYDAIDLADLRRRDILASHAPGATSHAVAEFALALALASLRNLAVGERVVRAGKWGSGTDIGVGQSLKGARVGIVGLGAIGEVTAELFEAMGADVCWWGPRPKDDARWPYSPSLLQLAKWSDVMVICARAHDGNRHLISREIIDALGPQGLLVNVARGQLLDEDAVIAALREGRLGRAALDVFDTEPTPLTRWHDVPNVVMTPHIGGASTVSTDRMTTMLMDNLTCFFAGRPLSTPIVPPHADLKP